MPRAAFDLQPPTGLDAGSGTTTPAVLHSRTLERQFHLARLGSYLHQSWGSLRALAADPVVRGRALAAEAADAIHRRPAPWLAALLLVVAGISGWTILSTRHQRLPEEARELLAAEKLDDARDLLRAGIARTPERAELHLLLGHVLHELPGQAGAAVESYATAQALAPLDAEAIANLVEDLGSDRTTADRASHLLLRIGPPALPAILPATSEGPGPRRLRALTLARDLGAEEQVNRVAAYSSLLREAECELRRAAARRLGEIGDPDALPALREAAKAARVSRGLFGRVQRTPVCGAPDAAAAVTRIEAAQPTTAGPAPEE